jgi:hypothetical protein
VAAAPSLAPTPAGDPASIFISYSHADRQLARKLYEGIRARGHQVWIDEEELRVGDRPTGTGHNRRDHSLGAPRARLPWEIAVQLVPTNRPKPARERTRRGVWRARPFADLRTDSQFVRETRRQELLDRRWQRQRSMIVTFVVSIGAMTGAIPLERVVDAMLKVVGIP